MARSIKCPLCDVDLEQNDLDTMSHSFDADCVLRGVDMEAHQWQALGSFKMLLEAAKLALYESSLDDSETVLSERAHAALNNAVAEAEGE